MKQILVFLAGMVLTLGFTLPSYAVSKEEIKVNGLMQFQYQNDKGATPTDTFRLRRAEIKLSGQITPQVLLTVVIDPAQVREDDTKTERINGTETVTSVGRKSPLQDFVITLKPHEYWSIDFGQYKVPFGMEGLASSSKLDVMERAALASQFKWADARDVGFTLKGNFEAGKVKIQSAAGLFNGEGQNKLEANNHMDFVGRLVVEPNETLHLGVAHYNGQTGTSTDNTHTGIEIKFAQDPVTLYGEYATGKKDGKDKKTYYLTAGYKFADRWQVVARYDWYDSDTKKKDDAKTEVTLGLNYFIEKHNAKVQLNYVSKGEEGTSVSNDVVRGGLQVSY